MLHELFFWRIFPKVRFLLVLDGGLANQEKYQKIRTTPLNREYKNCMAFYLGFSQSGIFCLSGGGQTRQNMLPLYTYVEQVA